MPALSIFDVPCPACGAGMSEPCRPSDLYPCAERWQAWAEAEADRLGMQ